MGTAKSKRGRKPAHIETLERLIQWAGGRPRFCRKTGIHQANLTAYLCGAKPIADKRLRRCAEQIFGEPPAFVEQADRSNIDKASSLLTVAGVYALFDSAGRVLYFGKASNLRAEVRQTLWRRASPTYLSGGRRKPRFKEIAWHCSAWEVRRGDAQFRHDVEALVLRTVVNDSMNEQVGRFIRRE